MRPASTVLEDLLLLIERTELGARAAAGGRERWAISCARRAVSTNVEQLSPELSVLRDGLAQASRVVAYPLEESTANAYRDAIAAVERAMQSVGMRYQQTANRRRAAMLLGAQRAAEAVKLAMECAASGQAHARVAEQARAAFSEPEVEAAAQARRLLVCTRLLPTGADLLVRLDYAESLGKLPIDADARAWIEAQRVALMNDDEHARIAVLLRHLELVFSPELDRIR